ncbi:uncharacterized protein LOC106881932 [Octopus bimaculoides]|uniref:Uncharacterized protein n=1 Tax=Octopus bimaculoides TaxID=37653 RepID=A0A0L8FPX0_OCTBM|nr:uncharacterized protein LOC106881932 [Octopus bimaculoides]XP_052824106.1 uncharacterized protein LOC106881932 [Octopus bimaculoides]|eukprot:XP_014787945.1 PREDICTED: uncharacterized protein LOC106881932 [Octopus bimaculoides]
MYLRKKTALISCITVSLIMVIYLMDKDVVERLLHRENSVDNQLQESKFLLVLVTTWKLSPEKLAVYENTVHIWGNWPLLVQPVLYTPAIPGDKVNNSQLDMHLGKTWKIQNVSKVACGQIPVLKSMIVDVLASFTNYDFYGYANGDILFDESLINTLKSIKEKIPQNKPILIVGQRINVNFTNRNHVAISDILQIAQSGYLMKGVAVDYFITNQHFPWHKILDLVVGRIKYDNWLIYFANSQNITIIDTTHTLTAVHQTTTDGNDAGWKHPNKYCNDAIIRANKKRFRTRWGYIWCVPYYTESNRKTNEIEILHRKTSPSCKP